MSPPNFCWMRKAGRGFVMGSEVLTPRRFVIAVGCAFAALLLSVIVTPLLGPSIIEYSRAWAGLSPDREILFDVRIPRTLLAALVGGSLAVAGALLQALLRDALAEPYTIGISTGASLGAVLAICFGWSHVGQLPAVWASACAGAAVSLAAVLGIATQGRRMSSFTLLLAGVTLNSISFALILFLQSLASFSQSFAITRWLMGGLEAVEPHVLIALSLWLLPLCAVAFAFARQWNLLSAGEEWAAARGVNVGRLLIVGYCVSAAIVGAVTAIAGPIGFIGLLVPHALRLRTGADHRLLLPCAFCAGGAFLTICDTIARTAFTPSEAPVGVVTALCGGPFFLWLLRSRSAYRA